MMNNKYKISFSREFMTFPKPCKKFYLIQAGEALCPCNAVVPAHNQQWFEITFICNGKCLVYADNQKVELDANDIFLSFPNETHKIETLGDEPLRYICLAFFAKESSDEFFLLNKIENQSKRLGLRKFAFENEKPLLLNVLGELQNEDAYTWNILGIIFEQILINIDRKFYQNNNADYNFLHTNNDILAYDIIIYIDKNILTLRNLYDLEKVFFYKLQYLSKIFTAQTGSSIKSYYISKKMETAKILLQSGQTVTYVSELLGYSSIHSFSRAYKKYFNDNPSSSKISRSQMRNPDD